MKILINWLASALVIMVSAYLLSPGIHVASFTVALAIALVLGVINITLKPILLLLTLPINILTLGLFTLVINAVLIMLTTVIVPGFQVDNFWWALIFGAVISVVNNFLNHFN
ncbi:hypothetical protein A2617_02870 [Candidatus Daviesbacteria bacterium RIFOXYD1_FULL_41_10]|uniref:Phage holin family protein n=1 Tax=Candidatus Daviesbacteria bacterium RIFOXYD1_FULL_41_10 TaxID=1797801 RepID=A0A1F5N3P0_9BACT|nr:MAG: hypothetical protein A2617_02870 [Candidatus Daviesbacteria bacterium RIFOXYD1_FULL_41_10]